MVTDYDLIIVGSGMSGASLACALSDTNCKIALLEARQINSDASPVDGRGIALSVSSREIFNRLDIWNELTEQVVPIQHLHISEMEQFGTVRLSAVEHGLEALGYVVIAQQLANILLQKCLSQSNLDFINPAEATAITSTPERIAVTISKDGEESHLSAKLLIIADGAESRLGYLAGIESQREDYGQCAYVSIVTTEKDHGNTAYERFTPNGTVALLPSFNDSCVVIYVADETEDMICDSEDLLQRIQKRFGKRLGELQISDHYTTYNLSKITADRQVDERIVLLGNAAHTIHPNGAQGFNLSLRDAVELAGIVQEAVQNGRDPGDYQILDYYVKRRKSDQDKVNNFSEQITGLFYSKNIAKKFLRQSIMFGIDSIPAVKEMLVSQATGIRGLQPSIVAERLLR